MRSWRRTGSGIRRLDLVGAPETPDSIDLLDDSLNGWASYHHPEFNDGYGNWETTTDQDGNVQLLADTLSGLPGSDDEDLIRYVRPLKWDATIRYQFRYQPGTHVVHPAIGRLVFLISNQRVTLHQVTDGRFERSGLRPDNQTPWRADDATPAQLSTHEAQPRIREGWNDASLSLVGDRVELEINDRSVAFLTLPKHNSRKFGLFRYRDRTKAAVRNLWLEGQWPRANQQMLSSKLVTQLDREADDLSARFAHDFRQGIPLDLFHFNGDDVFERVPDGVRMTLNEEGGVREMRLSALIEGDFDIVATYKNLEVSDGPVNWHCGVGVAINLDNPTGDHCAIYRRRDRMQGRHCVGFGQKEINAAGKTAWVGGENIVDESTSGRLRLVRRGNKVYGLHAIEDSPSFRVVRVTDVPDGRIALHGLRFVADIGDGLETSVTWTNLDVRAEKIDLLQVNDQPATLTLLDGLRKQRPDQSIDLTNQTLEEAGIVPTQNVIASVQSDERGATISVLGNETSKRFSLYKSMALGADFDVQVDFDVLQLDRGP
ncbi:MAG: DUF1583 domain-containing protein, partial [Planctomycetota bacterium]